MAAPTEEIGSGAESASPDAAGDNAAPPPEIVGGITTPKNEGPITGPDGTEAPTTPVAGAAAAGSGTAAAAAAAEATETGTGIAKVKGGKQSCLTPLGKPVAVPKRGKAASAAP